MLSGVDLVVEPGEILVVVGKSGCGKTTLLMHVLGLVRPWEGHIMFDGKDIWESPETMRQARRRWGVLFQSGALLANLDLLENVMLPLREYTDLSEEEVRLVAYSKLATVDLAEHADSGPLSVSGGQQKRAGLARAMAMDPDVLFFDEPSAGLDPVTSHSLDRLIRRINRTLDTTMFIVTHELTSIFAISDRVVMLDAEERGVIAEGTAVSLRDDSRDERVRAFFNRRAEAI